MKRIIRRNERSVVRSKPTQFQRDLPPDEQNKEDDQFLTDFEHFEKIWLHDHQLLNTCQQYPLKDTAFLRFHKDQF